MGLVTLQLTWFIAATLRSAEPRKMESRSFAYRTARTFFKSLGALLLLPFTCVLALLRWARCLPPPRDDKPKSWEQREVGPHAMHCRLACASAPRVPFPLSPRTAFLALTVYTRVCFPRATGDVVSDGAILERRGSLHARPRPAVQPRGRGAVLRGRQPQPRVHDGHVAPQRIRR